MLSRASSVASFGESRSRASLSEYFAGSELDESNLASDDSFDTAERDDDDGPLWLGSLRPDITTPSEPTIPRPATTAAIPLPRRGFFYLRLQLPDPQALNPALYVTALNDLLQPYLQALRLTNPDNKHLGLQQEELPPPAYSELFPVQPAVEEKKFSLATRLSLRGRSFLRWTGMAGDARLCPQEVEFLRREDGRRKAWTRDYMLLFFWVFPCKQEVLTAY